MLSFGFHHVNRILCLGAHADDIEIGCGGTLLRLLQERPKVSVDWIVFSAAGPRRAEAQTSAELFLHGCVSSQIVIHDFHDSFFPAAWSEIKDCFAHLARQLQPDLVFTHRRDDAHQDHRVLAELTWCAFRNHAILEYEIPKYEGDLGQPNVLVPLSAASTRRKSELLLQAFVTQRAKPWFTAETFQSLARIRGIECCAPEGYAEGFHARKLSL